MSVNILLVILVAVTIFKIYDGYKRGLVKEIISLVSLIVLSGSLALIAGGISKYQTGKYFNTILAAIFFIIVIVLHFLLGLVLIPAKIAVKLPIIKRVDKICGAVLGSTEGILFLWTVYAFSMLLKDEAISQMIFSYVEDSKVLLWFYQHNYLVYFLEQCVSKITFG